MSRRRWIHVLQAGIFSLLSVLFLTGLLGWKAAAAESLQEQNLDYSDSLDTLSNPERGFYSPCTLHLKPEGTSPANPGNNLVHLRVDIAAFSSNALIDESNQGYGQSMPLTEDALQVLGQTLENIKQQGHSVIIRTCYDPWYGGKADYEPDQDTILGHLQQLGEVYTRYKDVIAYVELGTYGPWGEMHTSKSCTTENVSQALDTLLAATPEDIKMGVRTPNYVAGWLGIKNNNEEFDIESDIFKQAVAAKGTAAYRVGMYNDGYLGSSSDLGTFGSISRETGVAWLNTFANYTLYGGEVVADATGSGSVIGPYNSIEYISEEGFKTHTSYLNIAWNNNVIAAWKESVYHQEGDEYDGQTGFKYVEDHLGYRLVLRDSKLADAIPGGDLSLSLQIENVGFANIVNGKKVSIILKNEEGQIYEIACPGIDPNKIVSGQNNELSAAVSLPEDIALGTWNAYLRISKYGDYTTDDNYHCIRFANTEEYWDEVTGANYIGNVNIAEELPETPSDDGQGGDIQGGDNQPGDDIQGGDTRPGDDGQGDDSQGSDKQPGEDGQGDNDQGGSTQPGDDEQGDDSQGSDKQPGDDGQGDDSQGSDKQPGDDGQGDNDQGGGTQPGDDGQGGDTQGGSTQPGYDQGDNGQIGDTTQEEDTVPAVTAKTQKPAKAKILSAKNKKGRKIKIKIKKQKGVKGYQIAYGTKKSIKKAKKKFVKKQTVTLKKMKKKRTYYVAVRAYRKVNGIKVYGKWSKIKRITIRK